MRIAQSKRARRAGSLPLAFFTSHKFSNLYPPGVWFADAMAFFSSVTFVLFCFVFRLYAFVEAAALRSIVLRYAGVPIATRISFFLSFIFVYLFGDVAFS